MKPISHTERIAKTRKMKFTGKIIKNVSIKLVAAIAKELDINPDDLYFYKIGKEGYGGYIKPETKLLNNQQQSKK